jgi:hypothetical protein
LEGITGFCDRVSALSTRSSAIKHQHKRATPRQRGNLTPMEISISAQAIGPCLLGVGWLRHFFFHLLAHILAKKNSRTSGIQRI